jgi:hypothetical protein
MERAGHLPDKLFDSQIKGLHLELCGGDQLTHFWGADRYLNGGLQSHGHQERFRMENPDLILERILRFLPSHRGEETPFVRVCAIVDGCLIKLVQNFRRSGVKGPVGVVDLGDSKHVFALLLCLWAIVTLQPSCAALKMLGVAGNVESVSCLLNSRPESEHSLKSLTAHR